MRGECNEQRPDCIYAPDCWSNTHHKYWPAHKYRKNIPREFRELPENKEQMCRYAHYILHLEQDAPPMPSIQEMKVAIRESRG